MPISLPARQWPLASALILILALTACSGDGDGGPAAILDGPQSLSGNWMTTTTEMLDTCGFDPLPASSPLRTEEAGDSLIFTFLEADGHCESSARQRNGTIATFSRTDTIDAPCGIVLVQSQITYNFTENGFSGSASHVYTNLDGACANLPCEYRLFVAGVRCEDCWPGCADAAATESTGLPVPERFAVPGASAVGPR